MKPAVVLAFALAATILTISNGHFLDSKTILNVLRDKTITNDQLGQLRQMIQNTMDRKDDDVGNDDPDFNKNITQLITSKGYPVEEHQVITPDGYILGLQRIPMGRKEANRVRVKTNKPVVYLHHGLESLATQWVLDFPEQSLGYILADAGYDVWLGNCRGSKYSKKHVTLTPRDKEYWKFSWDEIALIDLPAAIDYILNQTSQAGLYYIGHSMGTTIGFAMLSELPQYNDKVKAFIALAPVANLTYITSPLRYLAPFAHDIEFLLELFGEYEFEVGPLVKSFLVDIVCSPKHLWPLCENLFFLFGGYESKQLNETRVPVYLGDFPGGSSTLEVVHYAQVINAKRFQKFDYGKKENMKRYGQDTPPGYDIRKITTPIALYYGLNDLLADPADAANIVPLVKNLLKFYQVPYPAWTHLDFTMALEANKYLYPDVLETLKSIP